MSEYLKVKNRKDLIRDIDSKAIINTDKKGLDKAKKLKARLNKKDEELQDLKSQVKTLTDIVDRLLEKVDGFDRSS